MNISFVRSTITTTWSTLNRIIGKCNFGENWEFFLASLSTCTDWNNFKSFDSAAFPTIFEIELFKMIFFSHLSVEFCQKILICSEWGRNQRRGFSEWTFERVFTTERAAFNRDIYPERRSLSLSRLQLFPIAMIWYAKKFDKSQAKMEHRNSICVAGERERE